MDKTHNSVHSHEFGTTGMYMMTQVYMMTHVDCNSIKLNYNGQRKENLLVKTVLACSKRTLERV